VMMPEKDGIAATRDIRAMRGPVGNIPIVAVTANAFRQHQDMCLEAGMDGFLTKPIVTSQLVAVVQRAADGTLRQANTADATPDMSAEPSEVPTQTAAYRELVADLGHETAQLMLSTMLEEVQACLAEILTASETADMPALRRAAQTMRCAAETLGLERLAEVVTQVTKASPEQLPNAISALEAALERVREVA